MEDDMARSRSSPIRLPKYDAERLRQRVDQCRATWHETGDPLALAEAQTWIHLYWQPIPPWLEAALVEALVGLRTPQQSRDHRNDMRHWHRWRCIKACKANGATWNQACEQAAQMCGALGDVVDAETVRKSYDKVRRSMRNGHAARYRTLKDRRYRHLSP
jgi:hypothetical protein